ncbi:hypothetical protein ACLOJK_014314 [Asimina triloba]
MLLDDCSSMHATLVVGVSCYDRVTPTLTCQRTVDMKELGASGGGQATRVVRAALTAASGVEVDAAGEGGDGCRGVDELGRAVQLAVQAVVRGGIRLQRRWTARWAAWIV